MRVLQFGFDPSDPRGPHRMENHTEDSVVYTGTHDSDTVRGWYESLRRDQRDAVDSALQSRGIDAGEIWWALIELAWSSPARMAMLQAQDVLGIGSEGRMNMPGTKGEAWRWQMRPGALSRDMALRLRSLTEDAGRI
jgi:4-alpha-glucanotransferase